MGFAPYSILSPYQRKVYDDPARFIAWVAGRQCGKSFTGAAWACNLCFNANTTVLIGSPSERQSLEAIEKCKAWATANAKAIKKEETLREGVGGLMKSTTITFGNKSRIVAVPGRPDTVRGFTANVWLDEFAFFDDPDKTWKAILPAVSNELKGKKRVLLTSTPNGKGDRGRKFWEIITNKGTVEPTGSHWKSGVWSIHKTTILDAAKFLKTNVEEIRAAIDDEEAWAQEFMCEFIDGSKVLLTYEALAKCEDVTATVDPHEVMERDGDFVAGIDFGRTSDPTVMWILERMASGVLRTVGVIAIRDTNTVEQFNALAPYIEKCRKVCIDYTGPGIGFGDIVATNYGAEKATASGASVSPNELCTFSQNFKCEIFPRLKTAIDGQKILLPIDVDCREDLHEMQQIVNNGKYNYAARRTAEGHSDRCTALALALRASTFATDAACEPPDEEPSEKYKRGWL